jgi:hypothetical protein
MRGITISFLFLASLAFFSSDAARKGSIYNKASRSWQTYATATAAEEVQDRQAQAQAAVEEAQQQANAARDKRLHEEKELTEKVIITPHCHVHRFA